MKIENLTPKKRADFSKSVLIDVVMALEGQVVELTEQNTQLLEENARLRSENVVIRQCVSELERRLLFFTINRYVTVVFYQINSMPIC